ncbi:hypothetical protein D3C73_1173750 [compost metagenome]
MTLSAVSMRPMANDKKLSNVVTVPSRRMVPSAMIPATGVSSAFSMARLETRIATWILLPTCFMMNSCPLEDPKTSVFEPWWMTMRCTSRRRLTYISMA